MKLIYHNINIYLILCIILPSCSDGNIWDNVIKIPSLESHYLNINVNDLAFQSSATTKVADVKATNTSWQITGMNSSWLNIIPSAGDSDASIKIMATENQSGENSRTNILNFSSTTEAFLYKKPFSVTQAYASPYITVEKNVINLPGAVNTLKIPVKSNIKWNVSSNQIWAEAAPTEDSTAINIKVEANDTGVSRSAIITITGKVTNTIKLNQAVSNIDISSNASLQYDNNGGTYDIQFSSEAPWAAFTSESWLNVNPTEGISGISSLQISATPNESSAMRNGYVYLKIGGKTRAEISISQEGCYIEIEQNTLTLTSNESSQTIQVHSNTKWEIIHHPEWITFPVETGEGNNILSFSVKNNPNTTSRSGYIKIGRPNTTLFTTVEVIQQGKTFGDVIGLLSFNDKSDYKEIEISTDGNWIASTEYDWITITPTSGMGNSKIKIHVLENKEPNKRTGQVRLAVGNTVKTINIEQEGKYFVVNTSEIPTIPATGGSHIVSISTNDSWTASTSSSWITISPTYGQGSANIEIKAEKNQSIKSRTDTTIVTPASLKSILIITKQEGLYLRVNVPSLSFFARGGTSDPIIIESNGTYAIATNDNWININQMDDMSSKTFTVTVSRNENDIKREGKVLLRLTGLKNDETYIVEIPVFQSGGISKITTTSFPNDEDWNLK